VLALSEGLVCAPIENRRLPVELALADDAFLNPRYSRGCRPPQSPASGNRATLPSRLGGAGRPIAGGDEFETLQFCVVQDDVFDIYSRCFPLFPNR
jgi:hypothetical protein